jgi:carbonic anhydrase
METERLSRRQLFRHACCGGLGAFAALQALPVWAADAKKTTLTPDQALDRLKEGNRKFVSETPVEISNVDRKRRLEIARSQAPFAVIVACSDSRVPPELLFGGGLGELFIIRNAGNTVDTAALGSIEYAVYALGVPLIAVVGHERCGAVDAALSVVEKNAAYPGSLGPMIEPIIPAVLQARAKKAGASGEDLLDASVRENVLRVVGKLRSSDPVLREPLRAGKLKIVGARYDLDDSSVEFFEA